jgi:hypothetical protein
MNLAITHVRGHGWHVTFPPGQYRLALPTMWRAYEQEIRGGADEVRALLGALAVEVKNQGSYLGGIQCFLHRIHLLAFSAPSPHP